MSLEEKRKLILAFDVLVRAKINGTAMQYAKRLGISKSTFFRLLEYIRDELKAPILYDTDNGRYVYEKEGLLLFGFVPYEFIGKEELKKIHGGNKTYTEGSIGFENIFSGLNWRD